MNLDTLDILESLKPGYPDKLSTKEIQAEMDKVRRHAGNVSALKPDVVSAMNSIMQSGQVELNNRFAKKAYWLTVGLTLASVIAAFVSIWLSIDSDKSADQWRDDEITLLQQIKGNTQKQPMTSQRIEREP